jgi:hypothetical protein
MYQWYLIGHIFGAVLGAGAAYMTDAIFFTAKKDKIITSDELKFIKLGSRVVWIGIILSILSGLLLVWPRLAGHLESAKFMLKMFVFLVLVINGAVFHFVHLPLISRHADMQYNSSPEFLRKKKYLAASGAISMTSWALVIVLGVLRDIPLTLAQGIGAYLLLQVVTVSTAMTLSNRLI